MPIENSTNSDIKPAYPSGQSAQVTNNRLWCVWFGINGAAVTVIFISAFAALVLGAGHYGVDFAQRIHGSTWSMIAGGSVFLVAGAIFVPIISYREYQESHKRGR